MEVQQRQPQLLAACQFVDKGFAGFIQRLLNWMAEVNQVAVVRKNLCRSVVILVTGGFEVVDNLGG